MKQFKAKTEWYRFTQQVWPYTKFCTNILCTVQVESYFYKCPNPSCSQGLKNPLTRRPGLVISTFGLAEIISCMPDGLVKIYIGYWQTCQYSRIYLYSYMLFNQQQCFIYSTASFLSKLRAKKIEKLCILIIKQLQQMTAYRKFRKWNTGIRFWNRERLLPVLTIVKKNKLMLTDPRFFWHVTINTHFFFVHTVTWIVENKWK